MKTEIEMAIRALAVKSQNADSALAAMQMTQAVANLCGALATLKNV